MNSQNGTMLRRSNRSRRARNSDGNTESSGDSKSQRDPPPPPPLPPTHSSLPLKDARGYLQRIYVAIDQIYRRETTEENEGPLVGDIILQARCARVLTHLTGPGRVAYLQAIRATIPYLDGQANSIAQQMLRMGGEEMTTERFSNFVDRFGFLLLSVCAHSNSFCTLFATDSSAGQDQPLWHELCDLIDSHAYSIELFARTRGLDWSPLLMEGSNTWDQLVCQFLYDVLDQHSNFTENQVLGISDTEYRIRHELPDNIGHYHEWVVSSKPEKAYNPTMTYRTRQGRSSISVTTRQVNIDSSIILDNCRQFKWPKRIGYQRTGYLDKDPRSRGPNSDPCEVCRPEDVENNWAPQRCDHTLAQLCELRHSSTAKASSRIELLQYPPRGVGVRALEAFREGEILAEYIGEIYPSHVIRRGRKVGVELYRNEEGKQYQYEQRMEDCAVNDDQESKKKKKTTSSPDKTVNAMTIDPAIKVASRDIEFGEEITINYGPDYWQGASYGCVCQEDECIYWSPDQNNDKGRKKKTWGEEVERRRLDEEDAVRTASKKQNKKATQAGTKEQVAQGKKDTGKTQNKKATQAGIKKQVAQGKKDIGKKTTGAKAMPAPKKRREGAKQDDQPPPKRARKGAK